jgi:hypothetical protein
MPRQRIDMGSKWLLHNQGKSALFIGGFPRVERLEPMPGEIVQNRKYPDGLFKATFRGQRKSQHVLIEVTTYTEERALTQALGDLALAYSALRYLPEVLLLILRPKGKLRIGERHEVRSPMGYSRLTGAWKVVEVWTLPAAKFLEEGDVGAVPWITLMDFPGPPEALLERCAEKIEREAHPKDRADLLVVSQVMSELRFPNPELLSLLKGKQAMIESPLLQRMRAETIQELTLEDLKSRFGTVPRDVSKRLREIIDEKKQRQLHGVAITCPNMEAFRQALLD